MAHHLHGECTSCSADVLSLLSDSNLYNTAVLDNNNGDNSAEGFTAAAAQRQEHIVPMGRMQRQQLGWGPADAAAGAAGDGPSQTQWLLPTGWAPTTTSSHSGTVSGGDWTLSTTSQAEDGSYGNEYGPQSLYGGTDTGGCSDDPLICTAQGIVAAAAAAATPGVHAPVADSTALLNSGAVLLLGHASTTMCGTNTEQGQESACGGLLDNAAACEPHLLRTSSASSETDDDANNPMPAAQLRHVASASGLDWQWQQQQLRTSHRPPPRKVRSCSRRRLGMLVDSAAGMRQLAAAAAASTAAGGGAQHTAGGPLQDQQAGMQQEVVSHQPPYLQDDEGGVEEGQAGGGQHERGCRDTQGSQQTPRGAAGDSRMFGCLQDAASPACWPQHTASCDQDSRSPSTAASGDLLVLGVDSPQPGGGGAAAAAVKDSSRGSDSDCAVPADSTDSASAAAAASADAAPGSAAVATDSADDEAVAIYDAHAGSSAAPTQLPVLQLLSCSSLASCPPAPRSNSGLLLANFNNCSFMRLGSLSTTAGSICSDHYSITSGRYSPGGGRYHSFTATTRAAGGGAPPLLSSHDGSFSSQRRSSFSSQHRNGSFTVPRNGSFSAQRQAHLMNYLRLGSFTSPGGILYGDSSFTSQRHGALPGGMRLSSFTAGGVDGSFTSQRHSMGCMRLGSFTTAAAAAGNAGGSFTSSTTDGSFSARHCSWTGPLPGAGAAAAGLVSAANTSGSPAAGGAGAGAGVAGSQAGCTSTRPSPLPMLHESSSWGCSLNEAADGAAAAPSEQPQLRQQGTAGQSALGGGPDAATRQHQQPTQHVEVRRMQQSHSDVLPAQQPTAELVVLQQQQQQPPPQQLIYLLD